MSDRQASRVPEKPEQPIFARPLNEAIARASARAVTVAGLRPCYKYGARLPEHTFGGLGQQLHYTDALLHSACAARQLLALPYEPVCRLAVATGRWEPFAASSVTRRRTWAAFGQPGGGSEMVSAARFQAADAATGTELTPGNGIWLLDEILATGGTADDYCSIPHPSERGSLVDLVDLMSATATEFARELGHTEAFAESKTLDDSVAAAVVYWKHGEHDCTLSVTARVHAGYLNGLKFWAVFWVDDEKTGVRRVSRPIELLAPGVVVARADELTPYSEHSLALMTVLWEQLGALRSMLIKKIATDCSSEAVSYSLLP